MTSTTTISAGPLAALRRTAVARVIAPGDDDFDIERRVWNGMIDRHPALIAKCNSSAGVADALAWARDHDMPVSVRAGGHNAAGAAVVDDGVVIDVREMTAIELDTERRIVRAGGGVTIGELDAATLPHGLAVPMGIVTETGIAGLTLGGGVGWLRRKYGLACDNLTAAEVVTADGEIVRTSDTERPELLWGLRGGGGNLGIVTAFEFQAYPVGPDVFFAVVMHRADDTDATRFYRDWALTAPDEVSSLGVLWHAPAIDEIATDHHGEPIMVYVAMHCGTPDEGETALAPLREFGDPIADLSGPTPYLEAQQFFDEDYPKWEKRYYWTSAFVDTMPDELLVQLVELNAAAPSDESTIDLWQLGGAPSRVAPDATAFGERSAAFMVGIEANWEDADDDAVNIDWARHVRETVEPWSTGVRYANFPGLYEHDEAPDFFGANHERMARLKAEYDPTNVFSRNHNVEPSSR